MEKSPLDCLACSKELEEPVLLGCLHTVCRKCSSSCPTCSKLTEECNGIDDVLAEFLIQSSHEEADSCANCEQVTQPMFFCETCQQSLCPQCRSQTHSAKMFAKHRVIKSEERACVHGSTACSSHSMPIILYCSAKKKLGCIQCFNDASNDDRQTFVSIDVAHKICVEKIEQTAISLKKYQEEKNEELEVRMRMLTESEKLYDGHKTGILQICQQIVDTVLMARDRLLHKLEESRNTSEKTCREQIEELKTINNPLRLCMMVAQILCSSASKLDVLHLVGPFTERAQLVSSRSIENLQGQRGLPSLETRSEIAKALEPFLGFSAAWCPINVVEGAKEGSGSTNSYKGRSSSYAVVKPPMLSKFQALIDLSGAFGVLFQKVEGPLKDISIELAALSVRVQEMQRDLTLRRCLVKPDLINSLAKECQNLESRLGLHSSMMENMQPEMQEMWQEQLDRVRRQQIIYREKVDECASLRCTAREVLVAAKQIGPFAACIEQMSALIDPKRCHPPDPAPMESICIQISTIEPDSEGRIAAIEKEEQNRKAVQEAKKREEEATRGLVVKGLKHKNKRKEAMRTMVNTNRERSPGGTDATLYSPFIKLSSGTRDGCVSDVEEASAEEYFDLWSDETFLDADVSFEEHARSSSSLTINSTPTSPTPSVVPFRTSSDLDSSRLSMLQSLHDVFAHHRVSDSTASDERSVSASAVKHSQKKNQPTVSNATSPTPLKTAETPKEEIVVEKLKAESTPPSSTSDTRPPDSTVVPDVPYVPSSLFQFDESEKLSGFEAKEKVLRSLKEKVRSRANSDLS